MGIRLFLFVFIVSWNNVTVFGESENQNETKNTVIKKTIWKCCPKNQYVGSFKRQCTSNSDQKYDFSDLAVYDSDVNPTGRYLNEVYNLQEGRFKNLTFKSKAFDLTYLGHKHYMTEDGYLYVMIPHEIYRWQKLNSSQFCVDYQLPMPKKNVFITRPSFWCVMPPKPKSKSFDPIYVAGLLVSSVFLFLVLVVYCLLPELRNLGGLIVMAYVTSMFGSFVVLSIIQIGRYSKAGCVVMTCLAYFFILATFCWMNIMSCDIWWTFRGYAKARPIHRRGERFKYAMYCVYAWGLPFAMMIMLIVLNFVDMNNLSWFITPRILNRGCFLEGDAKLMYLYVPMLILISANWAFFLMTVFNIWRLHRSTIVLDSTAAGTPAAHRKQKFRLLIYLKLSIIMGINWVLEVVSSFNPHLKIWYFTDMYNILIGVCIFVIFVCKKKIFRRLFEEVNKKRLRPTKSSKSQSSNTTDSELSQDTSTQVCPNPKGSTIFIHEK